MDHRLVVLSLFAFPLSLSFGCASPSPDGAETSEQAAVEDRSTGSPFAPGACTGTPMTEADALARLGSEAGPLRIGSFVLGIRHRTPQYDWDSRRDRWDLSRYTWDDAPTDALVAWRETESAATRGVRATFGREGDVELAKDDDGAPYLRLVGRAAQVVGPDETHVMRLVSEPLRPWTNPGYPVGPRFALEESQGEPAEFQPVRQWGWSVQLRERSPGNYQRSWWFMGEETTAFVSDTCGQFVSTQSMSQLSPVSAALGVLLALDGSVR